MAAMDPDIIRAQVMQTALWTRVIVCLALAFGGMVCLGAGIALVLAGLIREKVHVDGRHEASLTEPSRPLRTCTILGHLLGTRLQRSLERPLPHLPARLCRCSSTLDRRVARASVGESRARGRPDRS